MTKDIEVKVPDIGGAADVEVIEILVKVGDTISKESPLVTLESDKASMEIPSSSSGVVKKILVKIGDKVSEGATILALSSDEEIATTTASDEPISAPTKIEETIKTPEASPAQSKLIEVLVPDIGGATDVDVIEVSVKPGDSVEKDQALITLEGDKATMEIPCPVNGNVKTIKLKVGDKVSQGSLILMLETTGSEATPIVDVEDVKIEQPVVPESRPQQTATVAPSTPPVSTGTVSAGPAVRRMAREFGIDLTAVSGSGRKSRISKEDLQDYVKQRLSRSASTAGFNIAKAPTIDFSQFGDIEVKPLNKIKRLTGQNLHRAWVTIPHVTQFDEADITDLEAFRKAEFEQAAKSGCKLTILAFVCGAVSKALKAFPQFNASLDASGESLVYKKYCNIGIAVETPNGLVVPVIKNVDTLSVSEIAIEMARLSTKARDKGLMPADMSGGCFTISSLGGIGGTAFTPIVNSPEVAILGLSRSSIKPVYQDNQFVPRLMLPLSLSYDHRVIDGAEAARFTRYLAEALGDIRKILL